MTRVLVTGASGFVGRGLCARLRSAGYDLVPVVHRSSDAGDAVAIDLGQMPDWRPHLTGCQSVVHLAARVHVMHDLHADPLGEFRRINTAGTLHLAGQAAECGIRRFVFISSAKVCGERGAFSEDDLPCPEDAYSRSKWEAEQQLPEICARSGMELVILRPPLVYGPEVGANFLRLLRLANSGWPLPLAAIENKRSLLYIGNFVHGIEACLKHPDAAGKTFFLTDGDDISTSELVRRLATAMQRPSHLFGVPPPALRLLGTMLNKRAEVDRLLDSLTFSSAAIRTVLGWRPPYAMDEGISATAAWFREANG